MVASLFCQEVAGRVDAVALPGYPNGAQNVGDGMNRGLVGYTVGECNNVDGEIRRPITRRG
jgi:hypothetical protein